MSIVCGTDFSDLAHEAGAVAAAYARASGGTVHLVHVTDMLFQPIDREERDDETVSKLRNQLRQQAEAIREQGVAVQERLLFGSPYQVLVEVARREAAELIVVGAIGSRPQTHWMLGSTAERLVRLSESPVLIVRDGEPLVRWFEGRGAKVLISWEFSSNCQTAATWLTRSKSAFPCTVTALHVASLEEQYLQLGRKTSQETAKAANFDDRLELELERALKRCGLEDVQPLIAYSEDAPDVEVVREAEKGPFDLVVVGTRQRVGISRLWYGSVSQQIIHGTPTNVLAVPPVMAPAEVSPVEIDSLLAVTDLSISGNAAIAYAYGVVPDNGTVTILHLTDQDPKTATEALQALGPRSAEERGVKTRILVVDEDQVAETAERIAEDIGAGAIVITGPRPRVVGLAGHSIVGRLLAIARRSVLVVPRD